MKRGSISVNVSFKPVPIPMALEIKHLSCDELGSFFFFISFHLATVFLKARCQRTSCLGVFFSCLISDCLWNPAHFCLLPDSSPPSGQEALGGQRLGLALLCWGWHLRTDSGTLHWSSSQCARRLLSWKWLDSWCRETLGFLVPCTDLRYSVDSGEGQDPLTSNILLRRWFVFLVEAQALD